MKEKNQINEFLKTKRISSGVTQIRVAEVMGYTSAQHISNIERGVTQVSATTAATLIDIYGGSREELFKVFSREKTRRLKDEIMTAPRARP